MLSMKKLHLCLALCATIATCYAAVIKTGIRWEVSIGSADAGTSLEFGYGADDQTPFPPFSGQFGVKDFFLVNSDEEITGDMARLGTDVRQSADTWKISCANANSTLYFNPTDDAKAIPMYYSYIDPKDSSKTVKGQVADNKLAVKAYTVVTISTKANPEAEQADQSGLAKKDDKLYKTSEREIDLAAGDNDITLIAGDAEIVACIGGKYYDETGLIANFDITKYTGYVCTFGGTGLQFKSYANGVLTITKDEPTRGAGETYQVTATKSNLPNLTATIDNQTLITIIEKFGTLDFDGNGVVDYDDVMYMFSFIVNDGHLGANVSLSQMEEFIETPNDDYATAARDTLKGDLDTINFSEAGDGVSYDDVMYMFSYIVNDGHLGVYVPISAMNEFIEIPNDDIAQKAKENLEGLTE